MDNLKKIQLNCEEVWSKWWCQHVILFHEQNRKRFVNVHVADSNGSRVVGAKVAVHQITRDFPFGSAISRTILGNKLYQVIVFMILSLIFFWDIWRTLALIYEIKPCVKQQNK